jgi:hypothetical protein
MQRTAASVWFLAASLVASPAVLGSAPRSPIQIDLKMEGLVEGNLSGEASLEVVSTEDAPGTTVSLILPHGMEAERREWIVKLRAAEPIVLRTRWWLIEAADENLTVSAKASYRLGPSSSWGDMKSIAFHLEPAGRPAKGWKVETVPMAPPGPDCAARIVSTEPLPFRFPDRGAVSGKDEAWAAAAAERPPLPGLPAPPGPPMAPDRPEPVSMTAPTAVTLTGTWLYPDRSGVPRAVDQQYLEIRKGDGTPLSPRVFCFTQTNGGFSCSFPHPGTSLRVWLRSATNLTPGPTRLGVFSGIEIPGGCGSDSIDCTYANTSAAVVCADGTTCNLGTMTAAGGEPWIGAHQMTQDLIRSWKKILFDTKHPSGTHSGPAKITYPSPESGPHAHVFDEGSQTSGDPWLSIMPPWQTAADVVAHEYGHAVMDNLWQPYTPGWPTDDCPSSHALGYPSGDGCALSEGFADYWSWYSNEFYDGDSDPANDGPVYDDPGFSSNFETRDDGTYWAGPRVEGNVAGTFGDMMDALNDGAPSCAGPGDRIADGIQHVWHVFYSGRYADFPAWYQAYWATFLHPKLPLMETALYNGIDFGFPGNDTCSGAQEITALNFTDSTDTTLTSCLEPGEPSPGCGNGSNAHSVYYRWTAPGSGTVTVDTALSGYDTILSVWSGSCGALAPVACNDDDPPGAQSRLVLGVFNGQTLTFMVSAYSGGGGALQFHLEFQPAPAPNNTCAGATLISSTPYGETVDASAATSDPSDPAHACAAGMSTAGSVFYRWVAPADGTLRADTLGSSYDTVLSAYTGACGALVSQACNDDAPTSIASEITLPVTAGTALTFMVSALGSPGILRFHLELEAAPPPHDACPEARVVSLLPYADASNTYGASTSPGDPPPGCGNQSSAKNAWYRFTAPISGVLTVDTEGSAYDTILSTWTGTCGALAEVAGGCNDDTLGPTSRVQIAVAQGTTYLFQVSAYHGDGGALAFHVAFAPDPPFNDTCGAATIVTAPHQESVYTAGATGTGEPTSPCGNGSAAKSVWYRFTAPVSGTLLLDTLGSAYDTILSVWMGGCAALTPHGCNDDAPGTTASALSVPVAKGVTYHIRSSAYQGDGGSMQFSLQLLGDSAHVPDGRFTPGTPLRVDKAAGGQVRLTWSASCLETDTDYAVYEGQIGSYYSHVPVVCSTAGSRDVTFTPAPNLVYYLVAPRNQDQEGSHGRLRSGVERGVAGLTCLGQQITECAPACAHSLCTAGPPLDPACSACAAQICAGTPSCCATSWDEACATEAQRSCGGQCP